MNASRWLRRWVHPIVPNHAPYWAWLPKSDGTRDRLYFGDYGAVPWTGFEEERWRVARGAFEDGLGFAREHGLNLVFVHLPIKFRIYRHLIALPADSPMPNWQAWSALPWLFDEFCASSGAPCLDLTGPLRDAATREVPVCAPSDTHWSPEGADLAAGEVARILESRISRVAHDELSGTARSNGAPVERGRY